MLHATPWGLLPLAVPLVVLTVRGAAILALPRAGFDTVLAGATLTVAMIAGGVRLLGALGMLTTTALLTGLIIAAVATTLAAHRSGEGRQLPWRHAVSWGTAPLLAVAAVAVALSVVAAFYLPVWQWDALGYHLPVVDFALQRGTFADLPADVAYLSSYPHLVEYTFIAWRAMIPDDQLVELAHLPFGLLGTLAIAAIAHHRGAKPAHGLAAGALWLTVPAVFLQLPTNYVDVTSAALLLTAIAFLTGHVDRRRILLAGLAIGLFLGSKPTAPAGTALLLVALVIVAHRAGLIRWAAPATVLALVVGGESYLTNALRHANPVWPLRLDIGPLHLPGISSVADLLAAGAGTPRAHGSALWRVLVSWTTLDPPLMVFDMRLGGFGLIFLVALAVAVVSWVRSPSLVLLLAAAACLATPDPAVARFVLGFVGLVLAVAASPLDGLPGGRAARGAVVAAAAVIAMQGVVVAYPGLVGEGPALSAYPAMTGDERRRAVGADGSPAPFLDAIAKLRPGQVTLFDRSADLPYLAWPADLTHRAERLGDDITAEEAQRQLDRSEVGMLIVGDDTVTGAVARGHPERFAPQFRCKSSTCTVYLRR